MRMHIPCMRLLLFKGRSQILASFANIYSSRSQIVASVNTASQRLSHGRVRVYADEKTFDDQLKVVELAVANKRRS